MADNKKRPHNELESSAYLLKRLETDMLAVHTQMAVLQIVFDNLKGSWLSISLAHRAFKLHNEDKP